MQPGTIPVALVAGCGMACEIASTEYKENAKNFRSGKDCLWNMRYFLFY